MLAGEPNCVSPGYPLEWSHETGSSAPNMQRARFKVIGLALLALGIVVVGCGSGAKSEVANNPVGGADGGDNNGSSANQGANVNGDDNTGNTGNNANDGSNDPVEDAGPKDGGPIDSGICTPMYQGCDDKYPGADPTTLCGQIDNGCGTMIDCDPEDDNCPGFGGACNDPAKPNQCGCAPKTCTDVVSGGAKCGSNLNDLCGGQIADCGTCPGAQDVCNTTLQCQCVPNNAACNGKVCGSASDGCNGTIQCGATAGACASGTGSCSGDQTKCECVTRAAACAGQPDGPLNVNGCAYVCGACVPDNAAACGSAECGTATNNCGEVVNCGSNAGGCEVGKSCIDPTYVELATKKVCVDNDLANLVGTYGVRTHAFRHSVALGGFINTYQRAEALSLVKITLKGAGRTPHMIDYGCAASSTSSSRSTTSVSSNAAPYDKIAAAEVDLNIVGNAAGTGTWTRPIIQTFINSSLTTNGVPTGFRPESPAYCAGKAGQTVAAPDAASRPWLTNGNCVCPADATAAAALPPSSSAMNSQDCRVTDADADGKPGFTVTGTTSFGSSNIYNVSISGVTWTGGLRADGFHTGLAIEPNTIQRSVVGCSPTGSTVCNNADDAPNADCACGDIGTGQYNYVQFVPLDGLSKAANTWTCADVKSNATGGTFSLFLQSFGACTANTDCPSGSLCKTTTSHACFPASSPSSCGTGAACPAGTECLQNTCWPVTSECPATSGQACTNPPN